MPQEAPVTHLIVKEEKEIVNHTDPGWLFPRRYVFHSQAIDVKRHATNPHSFSSFLNLKNTRAVKVHLAEQNGDSVSLDLPPQLSAAIAEHIKLLSEGKSGHIDCFSFACMANGMALPERNAQNRVIESQFKRWSLASKREQARSGDVFFILKDVGSKIRFMHAAVSIGHGLFVSVYGAGGELRIATMKDLKNDFRGTFIVRVVPRPTERVGE